MRRTTTPVQRSQRLSLSITQSSMVSCSTLLGNFSQQPDEPPHRLNHLHQTELFSPAIVSSRPVSLRLFFAVGALTILVLASLVLAILTVPNFRFSFQDTTPPTTTPPFFPPPSFPSIRASTRPRNNFSFPRPLFVVAGGAPRTGSTLIFNVLRVLMRLRDPNTVASSSWMLAKLVPENASLALYDRIAQIRTMATSLLIKVHTARQYYSFAGPLHQQQFEDQVDVLVTGYRDLRDECVSAFQIFVQNRSEWEQGRRWAQMCRALIRRRDSLIVEAGNIVPVVDVRFEDWHEGGARSLLGLIRRLGRSLPWDYSEEEHFQTLREVEQLRVPVGGDVGNHVEWHVVNLMSPRHISKGIMGTQLISDGIQAIYNDPVCKSWLVENGYESRFSKDTEIVGDSARNGASKAYTHQAQRTKSAYPSYSRGIQSSIRISLQT